MTSLFSDIPDAAIWNRAELGHVLEDAVNLKTAFHIRDSHDGLHDGLQSRACSIFR